MTDEVQFTCCAEATVSTCTCELGLPHSLHMAVFSMTQTHSGATYPWTCMVVPNLRNVVQQIIQCEAPHSFRHVRLYKSSSTLHVS